MTIFKRLVEVFGKNTETITPPPPEVVETEYEETQRMRHELKQILRRCESYPDTVFKNPDMDKARNALQNAGINYDDLHASWARYLLEEIASNARAGLNK